MKFSPIVFFYNALLSRKMRAQTVSSSDAATG